MASFLEQYQQLASGAVPVELPTKPMSAPPQPVKKLEKPIFSTVQIPFTPNEPLTHLVSSNDVLIMGMADKTLVKVLLKDPGNPEQISLASDLQGTTSKYRIHELFLDPLGNHLFISLKYDESEWENYYVFIGGSNKRTVHRFLRGHLVTSIAFNPDNAMILSTGCILIGTNTGIVFEAEFTLPDDRMFSKASPEKFCNQVYQLHSSTIPEETIAPITGLEMFNVSPTTGSLSSQQQTVIYLATARTLYQFFGFANPFNEPPVFSKVFHLSEKMAINTHVEYPNPTDKSHLKFFIPKNDRLPTHLTWLIGPVGVCHAEILVGHTEDSSKPWLIYAEDPSLIEFNSSTDGSKKRDDPLGIAVTEYHCLTLFSDRVSGYCELNNAMVYNEHFPQQMVGISRDSIGGRIWAFSKQRVYKYTIEKEDRNIWSIHLQKKNYEEAKRFARNDPVKVNQIMVKQANDYFVKGKYEQSALLFARTWSSFEEVSLKFLEMEQEGALRILLLDKLEKLKGENMQPQMIMIITWLLQLYLNRILQLKSQVFKANGGFDEETQEAKMAELGKLDREFRAILDDPVVQRIVSENKKPFYKLILSHGDEPLVMEFATKMNDLSYVVQHHIQNNRFEEAIETLKLSPSPDLFYQYSSELMAHLPVKLVDQWISMKDRLQPVKLIPSLVQHNSSTFDPHSPQMTQSVRYLEYCIYDLNCRDESIHNYIIALYARLGDPTKLEAYFINQGDDFETINYDPKYALRVCLEFDLDKARMYIYITMQLYSEAIDLALNVLNDIAQAKDIANRPQDDNEVKKKLWLKIAQHVISENKDVSQAMEFLQCCDLLKIEDILPFFPEFACIDQFKDTICGSLQEYKVLIQGLQEEMNTATQSADQIRREILQVKNRCFVVDRNFKCSSCSYAILNQSFFIFPCQHMFHTDCLYQQALPFLPPSERVRAMTMLSQLNSRTGAASQIDNASMSSSVNTATTEREKLKTKLTDLMASECLYCGELMADAISEPFVPMDEYEEQLKFWQ